MDHLAEQVLEGKPQDYYTRLQKMEREAGLGGRGIPVRRSAALASRLQRVPTERTHRRHASNWSAVYEAAYRESRTSGESHREAHQYALSEADQAGRDPSSRDESSAQLAPNRAHQDLPDTAFLYVAPGGSVDESGRTHPFHLRMLPYRDARGQVSRQLLGRALRELDHNPQLPSYERPQLRARIERLLGESTMARGSRDEAVGRRGGRHLRPNQVECFPAGLSSLPFVLSDEEADRYAERHTATAMAQLRRAVETGVCSHPIVSACDDDPTSYYEIEDEAGGVRKMVL